ncbi:MAG: DMT family protein [Pirellulales bacterium]|nr:DMT family protein [Pirellulales bacterium]
MNDNTVYGKPGNVHRTYQIAVLSQLKLRGLGNCLFPLKLALALMPSATVSRWWKCRFSAPQLKILQEIITIAVFVAFNFLWLREKIRPTGWAAFALIVQAVVVMMAPRAIARSESQGVVEERLTEK